MRARAADPYRDTDVIDSRAPRFNQAVVGIVSVVAVLTGRSFVSCPLPSTPAR